MKEKGFTLIELIAVIILMGMILLIIFPATSRLIRSNENKKYDTYYDSVQEQIELYARTRRDELGGIKGSGCVDDKKLSDLKSYDYIKEYKEEKDVSCYSPSDFSQERLQQLGIKTNKEYVNIRIDNNKGRMTVQYSMICVRNYDDPSLTSLQYKKLIEKDGVCETYVPVVTNSLLNIVKGTLPVDNIGTTSYVKDNPTNNYVWYSGKMWRIINYDLTDRTIKLVTDDVVSIINYDNKTDAQGKFNNNYSTSNLFLWLKNEFLPTLRNPEKYLQDVAWYYEGSNSATVTAPITSGNSVGYKVGMINNFEYGKASGFLNKLKSFWLITTNKTDPEKVWYVNSSGTITSSKVSEFYGIRPSIVLKPNVTVINGGTGTQLNPYRLTGDIGANIGTELNTRFSGEYVMYKGIKYRISKTDPKYTKLVAIETLPIDPNIANTIQHIVATDFTNTQIKLHYFDKKYSDNTFVGNYLLSWIEQGKDKLDFGDFCRMKILKTTPLTATCPQEDIINTYIAIPKVGDMFTVCTDDTYWTLTNSQDDKLYVVNKSNDTTKSCTLSEMQVGETSDKAAILPVIIVKNTVKIAGGNGTINSPYTIQ